MGWIRRRVDVVVASTLGLATAVVLAGNIGRSFDFDESVAVRSTISRGDPLVAFTETQVFNTHPIFAAWQSAWWALGGEGEIRQRVFPVAYGALAVAVLTGWIVRRFGARAGVAAGLVVILNPMFVGQARAVRGYSLVVLGTVVAVVCLLEYVRLDGPRDRRGALLLAGHAVGIIVAMGTHLFAGGALGPVGVAALVLLGRVDRRLVASWIVAGIGVVFVYAWIFQELVDTANERPSFHRSFFGELALEELLGRDPVTVALVGGVVVFAALGLLTGGIEGRSRVGVAAVLAGGLVVGQIWFFWQIAQPPDLYPRFFIGVVPLVAVAVAVAVRAQAVLLVVVAVAMALVVGEVRDIRDAELPLREAGAVAEAAGGLGWEVCAVGADPVRLYSAGVPVAEFGVPADPTTADFGTCGVLLRVGSWGRPLDGPAADHFAFADTIGSIGLYSQVPLSLLGR